MYIRPCVCNFCAGGSSKHEFFVCKCHGHCVLTCSLQFWCSFFLQLKIRKVSSRRSTQMKIVKANWCCHRINYHHNCNTILRCPKRIPSQQLLRKGNESTATTTSIQCVLKYDFLRIISLFAAIKLRRTNVYASSVSRMIPGIRRHHHRTVTFVWATHVKIVRQTCPKIWYRVRIVDAVAIHHAFNSHQIWSYRWNATDGSASNVNTVRFAAHPTTMISCCSAMIATEGEYHTMI